MKKISGSKKIGIIGAGPAGLSAGYFLTKNQIGQISVFEASKHLGSMSRTIKKKGHYFDIGPHRFFSKNEEINCLIDELMGKELIKVKRYTPIYYDKKFYNYPIKLGNVVKNFGFFKSLMIVGDYGFTRLKTKLRPREEKSFEDWVTNRFGRKLFTAFFKAYTEKLWGVSTKEIGWEFAAQRIKGLNILNAIKNAVIPDKAGRIRTLVDEFKYPKLGIGRIYQRMAEEIEKDKTNNILLDSKVEKINLKRGKIDSISVCRNGVNKKVAVDELISSMPISDLITAISPAPPEKVITAAKKLKFRGLISVLLSVKRTRVTKATWIYVHEPKASVGRITELKNWSRLMIPAKRTSLIAEMWAWEDEKTWQKSDSELAKIAISDLTDLMGFFHQEEVDFSFVVREPKAYPAYINNYKKHLKIVKDYLAGIKNLQIVGRYGTFMYNNQDHSIETGIMAAKNILAGKRIYDITKVNSDLEYHEEKKH